MTKSILKRKPISWSLLTVSEVQSIIITVGNMAVCRQTWCWRSREFYILIHRQPKETVCQTGHSLSIYETSEPTSIVTHFLQQGHAYSNKATPPYSATPFEPSIQTHESMGPHPFNLPYPSLEQSRRSGNSYTEFWCHGKSASKMPVGAQISRVYASCSLPEPPLHQGLRRLLVFCVL